MSAPRILVLQHHPLEHPGVLMDVLADGGARLEVARLFDGDRCPAHLEGFGGLLVMGGPMGVNDDRGRAELAWLAEERALVAHAIAADLPTLGVCLGSQLIAAAAGAPVAPGPQAEIGWYRLTPTAAAADDPLFSDVGPFTALEWHRDVFPAPPRAVVLARSAAYPVQAFRLGRRVYGLLFHLEVDRVMVDQWRTAFVDGAELPAGDAAPDYEGANARAAIIARRLFLDAPAQ